MFGFFKRKPVNPDAEFEALVGRAVSYGRAVGLSEARIANELSGYADSIRRIIAMNIEQRKYGAPVHIDASLPQ
jgi:hypothetical protein